MILFEPRPDVRDSIRARLAAPMLDASTHLIPIFRAVAEADVVFATVLQNEEQWTIPSERPAVLIVGDDLDQAKGPRAFSERSLRAFLTRCEAVAFVGCEAVPTVYAEAARMARDGYSIAIIESQPEHEEAWLDVIERFAPAAKLLVCRPFPRSMTH